MDTWNGRVEETGLYERMGWKSVGVAFCVGLAEEVEVTLCEFLRAWRCSPIYGSEGGIEVETVPAGAETETGPHRVIRGSRHHLHRGV
ncbi:DUF1847 domain-containing protein [Methanopyrus sp. SNP6]|uniref:DUF1847 domain-containing protein n=1 Tax=Methanopyrus sp. SNP6 TaxID=1937005 RepID=UPI001AEF66EC|nr:DUF1847 domain-containing protein [Methanopyrus sp. SNP6]